MSEPTWCSRLYDRYDFRCGRRTKDPSGVCTQHRSGSSQAALSAARDEVVRAAQAHVVILESTDALEYPTRYLESCNRLIAAVAALARLEDK